MSYKILRFPLIGEPTVIDTAATYSQALFNFLSHESVDGYQVIPLDHNAVGRFSRYRPLQGWSVYRSADAGQLYAIVEDK